jgi:hypothetical protein
MLNEAFVLALGALLFAYLAWGFRNLPQERWQILATLPWRPDSTGQWHGLNLTYYGVFSSAAQVVSVMAIFLLFGAVGATRGETALMVVVILGICIPASKLVALVVEKKSAVLTVGGAAFVGILLAPWALLLSNATLGKLLDSHIPVLPALAAMGIAYGFGEGLGRLACISFGCCYGKLLRQSHPFVQRLFRRWHFVFRGPTKKIAYAGNLEGEKVVPIQAVTALLYTGVGLAGMLLFLHGAYSAALLLTIGVTQLWRAFSETLRADYRGAGRISAYQVFAMLSVAYVALTLAVLPAEALPSASLPAGLEALWHPGMVLFLIGLWIVTFLYYARSLVTGSHLSLYVCHDRI